MSTHLEKLKSTWHELGRDDPLWAVVSHEDKRGGRWNLEEFLATGERQIADINTLFRLHAQAPDCFQNVLDFGCGVGRLTRAWSSRAKAVTGVDISAPMLERAQAILADRPNAKVVLNEKPDLSCFAEAQFDLVFSYICLQHMTWTLAEGYIHEFGRVCQPGGLVAFQLPARQLHVNWQSVIRKSLVDSLPFGLDRVYRRWRHGPPTTFEMHFTPAAKVVAAASAAGLTLVHQAPDPAAGEATEGYLYIFRRGPV